MRDQFGPGHEQIRLVRVRAAVMRVGGLLEEQAADPGLHGAGAPAVVRDVAQRARGELEELQRALVVEDLLAQPSEHLGDLGLAVRVALTVGQRAERHERLHRMVEGLPDVAGANGGQRRDGVAGRGGQDVPRPLEQPRGLDRFLVGLADPARLAGEQGDRGRRAAGPWSKSPTRPSAPAISASTVWSQGAGEASTRSGRCATRASTALDRRSARSSRRTSPSSTGR